MYSFIDKQNEVAEFLEDHWKTKQITFTKYAEEKVIGELRFVLFDDSADLASPKNIVLTIKNSIPGLKLEDELQDVPMDFFLNLQNEHGLEFNYTSNYVYHSMDVFVPLKESKTIDLAKVLGVDRPAWSGSSDNFTFSFLKSIFKAMSMSGYSSKSKEQLLDEVLERFTENAIESKPAISSSLILEHRYARGGRNKATNTIEVTDYNEAIGIVSRVVGKSMFLANREPAPDIRTLEASYELIELVDPYDGLDKFLEEQKPKKKKIAKKS